MKKLFYMLVCVLLVAMVAVTVFADGSAEMTIGASESTVYREDTVSFTVTISSVEDCRSAGIALSYDKNVFEFVSGKCSLTGTALANFSDGTGVFAYSSAKAVSGEIFTFQLKVKSDAALGDYSITANGSTRNSDGAIPTTVNPLSITVGGSDTTPTEGTEPVDGDATAPTEGTRPSPENVSTEATKPLREDPDPAEATKSGSEDTVPTEETNLGSEDTTVSIEDTESVGQDTVPTEAKTAADGVPPQSGFPWWILAAGGAIAIGGVVFFVVRKKNSD